jgi:hypothetical protein
MPRYKKPDAPKFPPVEIAGYRPVSLAMSEEDRSKMVSEDFSRIVVETTSAALERLVILRDFLGVEKGDFSTLALAIARRYVPDFEVKPKPRTGRLKHAERFKIVTSVEATAAKLGCNISISTAIKKASEEKISGRMLSAESLSTKYYQFLKEIEARPTGAMLLRIWRMSLPEDNSEMMDPLFWQFESDELGAVRLNNVHKFPAN